MSNIDEIKDLRKKAKNRKRSIIYNNDGDEVRYLTEKGIPVTKKSNTEKDTYDRATPEGMLAQRVTPLIGSQVDSIFYCTGGFGFGVFEHRTSIGQINTNNALYEHSVTKELIEQGTDSLEIMVDFCKENNIEVFWTMRMNDIHDSYMDDIFNFNEFKKSHPEYLIGTKENPPNYGYWSAVDYGHEEVREKAFKYIEEVCKNYDVDGIELDFLKHETYFEKTAKGIPAGSEELEKMTGLVRRIREMTETEGMKRSRPFLIGIRVPDSLEYCRALGLDIEKWLAEGLIDLMSVSDTCQFNPYRYSVALGHKYGVKVYPCLTSPWIKDEQDQEDSEKRRKMVADNLVQSNYIFKWSYTRNSLECYRARAMDALNSGADGVYLFNFFIPKSPLWNELADIKELKKMDKVYLASVLGKGPTSKGRYPSRAFINTPTLTPQDTEELPLGVNKRFEINIGDDVDGKDSAFVLSVRVKDIKKPGDISVGLNGFVLENGALSGEWTEYETDKNFLKQGINVIEIKAKKQELILFDIKITVKYL